MIDVILPVLDEAGAIPRVLSAFPDRFRPIVVDNGSTDGSAGTAEALGALVLHEPQRGFGAACDHGLRAATSDVVCFMDCDATLDPTELPRVASLVLDDRADLAIGVRRPARGAWPVHARVANTALALIASRRAGVALRDLGPMRAARRHDLLALDLLDRRFGWPLEMVLRAAAAGWRIEEIDVSYHPRVGTSKVTGTVRGTVRTVRDMVSVMR